MPASLQHENNPAREIPDGVGLRTGYRSNGNECLDLLSQPLSGDVQTSLDGTQGRIKLVAHLQQRLTIHVERDQSFPVKFSKSA